MPLIVHKSERCARSLEYTEILKRFFFVTLRDMASEEQQRSKATMLSKFMGSIIQSKVAVA
jgi:hypothetical protein